MGIYDDALKELLEKQRPMTKEEIDSARRVVAEWLDLLFKDTYLLELTLKELKKLLTALYENHKERLPSVIVGLKIVVLGKGKEPTKGILLYSQTSGKKTEKTPRYDIWAAVDKWVLIFYVRSQG